VAGVRVPGILQSLYRQATTPVVMLLSLIFLKKPESTWKDHLRSFYTVYHYVGVISIIAGILVVLIPDIPSESNNSLIWWQVVYILSDIPKAFSMLYKEHSLKSVDLNVWYLNAWVAAFQFPLEFVFGPIVALGTGLPIQEIPENLWHAFLCFLTGTNFITKSRGFTCSEIASCIYSPHTVCCDSCDGSLPISTIPAVYIVILYFLIHLGQTYFVTALVKHTSATFLYLLLALIVPLSSVTFALPFLMTNHVESFNVYKGVGLVVITGGLLIYTLAGELLKVILCDLCKQNPKQENSQSKDDSAVLIAIKSTSSEELDE